MANTPAQPSTTTTVGDPTSSSPTTPSRPPQGNPRPSPRTVVTQQDNNALTTSSIQDDLDRQMRRTRNFLPSSSSQSGEAGDATSNKTRRVSPSQRSPGRRFCKRFHGFTPGLITWRDYANGMNLNLPGMAGYFWRTWRDDTTLLSDDEEEAGRKQRGTIYGKCNPTPTRATTGQPK